MKKEQEVMVDYEAPKVEVIEVVVEKGFTASLQDYDYEGNPFVTNP